MTTAAKEIATKEMSHEFATSNRNSDSAHTSEPLSASETALLNKVRRDFQIIEKRSVHGKRLVYLDNAATSQKPECVIESLTRYYREYNANIHRGLHTLSEEATSAFEASREKVRAFIDAGSTREIIFTKGTTESINLVAESWARHNLKEGDEIAISAMEHHSNFVPWQVLAQETGARLVFLELDQDGLLDMEAAREKITDRTKLVAVTQMSNVLGTITPCRELVQLAHSVGAKILIDGAQGVPHLPTSVKELDCDFLAFSFHKMLGPTGVGVLYGKEDLLESMPPYMYGGDMISSVHRDRTRFNELPWKFEAGTPNIADVIACGEALSYLAEIGMQTVRKHELALTGYALKRLAGLPDLTIYGPQDKERRGGVISFNYGGIHPHDIGQILDESGIAIRAGHHCCQPLMDTLGVQGTARASFYIYNTEEEIDLLVSALEEANKVLAHVPR